jgi:CRISPR-associated protein Cas2
MTVLVLVAVPPGLRGHLSRWLLEIGPGVFVGTVTARVRDHLWTRVNQYLGTTGRAIMVYPARNEQGFVFKVAGDATFEPVDYDKLILIRRRSLT